MSDPLEALMRAEIERLKVEVAEAFRQRDEAIAFFARQRDELRLVISRLKSQLEPPSPPKLPSPPKPPSPPSPPRPYYDNAEKVERNLAVWRDLQFGMNHTQAAIKYGISKTNIGIIAKRIQKRIDHPNVLNSNIFNNLLHSHLIDYLYYVEFAFDHDGLIYMDDGTRRSQSGNRQITPKEREEFCRHWDRRRIIENTEQRLGVSAPKEIEKKHSMWA